MSEELVNVSNSTLEGIASQGSPLFNDLVSFFRVDFPSRLYEILTVPVDHPDVLWMAIPLLTTLFLLEFYFGHYSNEELGWNTALGNSLVLIFVSIDLFRLIYDGLGTPSISVMASESPEKFLLAFFVGVEGLWLMFSNFFHLLPKKIAFAISSVFPINMTAYLSLVIVYAGISIDIATIAASIFLFVVLLLFFRIVRFLEPKVIT